MSYPRHRLPGAMLGSPRDAGEQKEGIMPRERVQHGKLYVEDPTIKPTPVITDSGQPSGVQAYGLKEWPRGEAVPEGVVVVEEPSLDVTWRSDAWVQVSIKAPASWWEKFEQSRRGVEQSHFGVYSATLTRAEINAAIRALRRARNAVFGSDE
ncbi:hypothetical protein SEA_MASHLEY_19 [Microbacterium phage Mashley]|nr:hypothetical protein SEA_MASHLEY_19 [Microbacterium phage Mashley]